MPTARARVRYVGSEKPADFVDVAVLSVEPTDKTVVTLTFAQIIGPIVNEGEAYPEVVNAVLMASVKISVVKLREIVGWLLAETAKIEPITGEQFDAAIEALKKAKE